MAKVKCSFCNAKAGKRVCKLKDGSLICPVCCAKNRNEECTDCKYYQASEDFTVVDRVPGAIIKVGAPDLDFWGG